MALRSRTEAFLNSEDGPLGKPWLPRVVVIVMSVLLLSNLAAAIMAGSYQLRYRGQIFPGVAVWGVDVSGLTPDEAKTVLAGHFNYPQSTAITFRDGETAWVLTAAELGVHFDIDRTVEAAYAVGRDEKLTRSLSQQAAAWRTGVAVSPVVVFDQIQADAYLQQMALAINRPVVDATINIAGTEVVTTPSQIGREMNMPATVAALGQIVTTLQSGELIIPVEETQPLVTSTEDTARQVRAIIADDLEVYIEEPYSSDPGPWIASRQALAEMVLLELVPNEEGTSANYNLRLNEAQLRSFLEPLAPALELDPVNARFDFDDSTASLLPIGQSQPGRALDVPATIQLINQMTLSGEHRVPLVFEITDPDVPDTATAEELGITQLVASATTYYYGSGSGRRANIQQAASRFNGVIVGPGEDFSFNYFLGDVSIDSGFETAMIIYNGRTIEGVGGGVCQVSTTVFQAAFYAGFPILERVPHGYFVGYYETGEGPGLDATVFSPLVDFSFNNDLPDYLLIETSVDTASATVTFRFYSTSDGRTVQKDGPYVSNRVPHGPPLYEENPELTPGETRQVDWAVDGFDVTVNRIVSRDGQILLQDSFFSSYVPWQAVYQVAPGQIPAGATVSGYTQPTSD